MARAIVLLNAFLYLCVIALGAREIYAFLFLNVLQGVYSQFLDFAVGIRLLVVIPSLICFFLLLCRSRFGRDAAFAWDITLAFLLGALPFVFPLLVSWTIGALIPSPNGWSAVAYLIVVVTFLLLAAALKTASVRQYFRAHA